MQNRLLFVLGLLTLATPSFAESTANTAGASTATSDVSNNSVLDNLSLSYFGIFHGPQVTNLSSPYTPDRKGYEPKKSLKDGTNNMGFDSDLTAAYMVTKDVGIGAYAQFYLFPVQGYGITMGDVGIKAFDKHFIKTPQLNVYSNFIVEAPVNYDKDRGVNVKIKMTPNVRYNFAKSRFAAGMWTEQAFYFGASDKIKNNKQTKLSFLPYVNYQLAPKWSLRLTYEYETDHMAGKDNFDFTRYQNDVMTGFVYSITPTVIVNPYLQFMTTEKIAIDRSSIGATISASI